MLQPIGRLLRLLRVYAAMDLLWIARDSRNFAVCFVSDGIAAAGAISTTFLLAERFDGIGVWSRDQILFMLGYAALVSGLLGCFCGFNLRFISRILGRGQLDHTLIQPRSIATSFLTAGFVPFSGLAGLVPGVALLLWAGARLGGEPTPVWWLLFVLNLVSSTLISLAYAYLWGSLAFWAPRAAEEISGSAIQTMEDLKGFPLDSVGPALIGTLTTVVPVGLTAWYPSRALLGLDPAPAALLVAPLAAVVAASLVWWIYRRGLAHYRQTGSTRYLSFGFRR
jgi:ABC-2 type transport system permease protein